MFEGPAQGAIGGCAGGGGFNELEAGIRRLLPLDNEMFALITAVVRIVKSPWGHLSVDEGGQAKRGDVPPPK
jgi:hypothetical protein